MPKDPDYVKVPLLLHILCLQLQELNDLFRLVVL